MADVQCCMGDSFRSAIKIRIFPVEAMTEEVQMNSLNAFSFLVMFDINF